MQFLLRFLGFLIFLATFSLVACNLTEPSVVNHPLDSLSSDEIELATSILHEQGLIDKDSDLPMIRLIPPNKNSVLAWRPEVNPDRRAFVNVRKNKKIYEADLDLTSHKVLNWEEVDSVQTNQIISEFFAIKTLMANQTWKNALFKRGYVNDEDVSCVPVTPGYFGTQIEQKRRLGRVYCFDKTFGEAHTFAHPIEGLYALIDLDTEEVLEISDNEIIPINKDRHDYEEDKVSTRELLNPVRLITKKGGNFLVKGNFVYWQNWSFHTSFDRRSGLMVSLVNFTKNSESKSLLYKIFPSEMFVPYMDDDEGWYFRTFMDIGEYGFGMLASTLIPQLDCPDYAYFQSVFLPDDKGKSYKKKNVFCIFERNNARPVWRHSADSGNVVESRPDIELVIRTIPTIGNYDYIIDYVFSLNGNLRVDVGATGIVAAKGVFAEKVSDLISSSDNKKGELVAPGLLAVNHDHFISFRIDIDVYGNKNTFEIMEVMPKKLPNSSLRKSLWTTEEKFLNVEGFLDGDPKGHLWRVINENESTVLGHKPGLQIEPYHQIVSILSPEDYPQARAAFSAKPLWVTLYKPEEMYASGFYPTQSRGGDGLPRWIADNENIRNKDIVLWYTLGFRHVVRIEDWPVMPTKWHSFTIRPFNFFNSNPAIDVPSFFR